MTRSCKAKAHDAKRIAGVTLLELLIVLALMAIVAGFVIPMFGGPRVDERAARVGAPARRGTAPGAQRGGLASAARRSSCSISRASASRSTAIRSEHTLPARVELKLFTAQNDLVDDNIGSIRFFPDGGSNGGRITVAAGERKFDVDVDWLTGRVAILD